MLSAGEGAMPTPALGGHVLARQMAVLRRENCPERCLDTGRGDCVLEDSGCAEKVSCEMQLLA